METTPKVLPVIVEADLPDGLDAPRRGTLDLLVASDDRETAVELPAGAIAQAMSEDEYRLVVPDSWAVPGSAAELHGRPWIVGPGHAAGARAFARFAALHGIEPSVRHQARQPSAIQVLVAGGLGAAVLPAYVATRLRGAVVTGLAVPGQTVVRLLVRTGPGGPPPAVRAARLAIRQAGLDAVERYAASGLAPHDPVVSARLTDPSERTSAERTAD
ncbi:LysR substrate-binding domain-containing protein [Actinospica sp.]|uniref:LysR substrate-binding domain-containing protein n=1 Tax=Actinospica sp. TaxID=1872142 RepID=UPI002B7F774A|nr:LysR substrate-binding domain-containing protein [Actinospica sp.]HWG27859.1 LysR substrate-binding domain-containing protein [Actinospica sp.]